MEMTWLQWILVGSGAFLLGISKSGIKGIGVFIVTLMAIVFGSKTSTGIVMPMLIVGDVFAVVYYNRHAQWKYIFILLPWMVAGVLLGVWYGKDLPENSFKQVMAVIIIISVIIMYWWERRKSKYIPQSYFFGGIIGVMAGFTTMVGNLAGAFANIYFLVMRLPKNNFIGTAAYLFFLINLFKLPFHIFSWETITTETLMINLKVLPVQVLGLLTGVAMVKKISDGFYRKMILILTALGAVLILLR
jgi:uncharacterized membrane protein YfcA